MTTAQRRFARVDDDDDVYDDEGNGPYDKRYPGQRVIADKGRVRVPIQLTDGMPDWMPPRSRAAALYDAANARPHYAVVDRADPHVRDAERAYYQRSKWLEDAWRGPSNPPPPKPEPDEDPRDAYIRQISNAWRTPPNGSGNGADAIETQRRRWTAESPTKDAALEDRDVAYNEYIHRLTTAWKRP